MSLSKEGLIFVDATEASGEGVTWAKANARVWVDCLNDAVAMLSYTLDELSEKSSIGRYVIARVEKTEHERINEDAGRRPVMPPS